MAVLLALAVVVLVLLAVVLAMSVLRYDTWRRKGVPYLRPLPLFGNCKELVLQRETLFQFLDRMYHQFPGKPLVGLYAGPSPVLLVKNIEVIKNITVKDFSVFTNHKISPAPAYDKTFSKFLFCLLDDEWRSTRNRLTPAFTSGRLKAMYLSVKANSRQLVENIRATTIAGNDVVLNDLCPRYGIDVIASVAFGIEAGALREREPSPYMQAVAAAFNFGALQGLTMFSLMFYPLLYHILRLPLVPDWRASTLLGLLAQSSEHRLKEPPRNVDIFDQLLSLKKTGELPSEICDAQVMQMQVAGSETTATAVMFALWLLALHPECQDRLREELKEAVENDGGEIEYETIHDLKYLDMVFKETIRLWPIMPFLDRVASQDYVVPGSNVKIEKGTVVLIPTFSIHRDPDYYENPDTFHPERFGPENAANLNKLAFIPFGSGPRLCIGSRFADMSVKSALAHVLLNFRIHPTDATPKSQSELRFSPASFIITTTVNLPLRFELL